MTTVQVATRVDPEQDRAFRRVAREIGSTPADATRFVSTLARKAFSEAR